MLRQRDDRGFSSVVLLVVLLPILLVVFMMCVDAGAIAYTWMRADRAAQSGAAASASKLNPAVVARATLSERMRRNARVQVTDSDITVSIVPASLFGLGLRAPARVFARAPLETTEASS